MLDKNGNKLLKPSPLKLIKKIGRFLFGDNRDKKDAANKLKEQQEALNKMTENFSKIDT